MQASSFFTSYIMPNHIFPNDTKALSSISDSAYRSFSRFHRARKLIYYELFVIVEILFARFVYDGARSDEYGCTVSKVFVILVNSNCSSFY